VRIRARGGRCAEGARGYRGGWKAVKATGVPTLGTYRMVVESRHVRGGFAAVIRHRRRRPTFRKAHSRPRVQPALSVRRPSTPTTRDFIEKE
jgi:hypothetical protein